MSGDFDSKERDFHFGKGTKRTFVSKRINGEDKESALRIASKVMDKMERFRLEGNEPELVIRKTPGGRHEIKAKFFEKGREIQVLTIQKFNKRSGPSEQYYFSFVRDEIVQLLEFIANIKSFHFPNERGLNVSDDELRRLIVEGPQINRILEDNPELASALAQSELLTQDIIAIGYRRTQLRMFEKLMFDRDFFEKEKLRLEATPEAVWQKFFEANHWIFGYGLSFVFLSALNGKRLEQVTKGATFNGRGNRVDALMRTQALISSLCFVEIKRHDTPLLSQTPYRTNVWNPSSELSGGVVQLQHVVQNALEEIGREVRLEGEDGSPTGETLYNLRPRSFLVVGNLSEFQTGNGVNKYKYSSFELYRKSIQQPEIITFDELLHRARYIVESHAH